MKDGASAQWNTTQPRRGHLTVCDSADGPVLSEVRQTQKDKCHVVSLICGIQKHKINEQTSQKQMHRHREQTEGGQRGWLRMTKVQGAGRTDGQIQKSPRGCEIQRGDRVDNTGILDGARRVGIY